MRYFIIERCSHPGPFWSPFFTSPTRIFTSIGTRSYNIHPNFNSLFRPSTPSFSNFCINFQLVTHSVNSSKLIPILASQPKAEKWSGISIPNFSLVHCYICHMQTLVASVRWFDQGWLGRLWLWRDRGMRGWIGQCGLRWRRCGRGWSCGRVWESGCMQLLDVWVLFQQRGRRIQRGLSFVGSYPTPLFLLAWDMSSFFLARGKKIPVQTRVFSVAFWIPSCGSEFLMEGKARKVNKRLFIKIQ